MAAPADETRGAVLSAGLAPQLGLVFAGGALGTGIRFALTSLVPLSGGLPITLAINATGAFALGWLTEWLQHRTPARRRTLTALLGAGLLGGYTTYGMFAVDTDGLLNVSDVGAGMAYAAASVVLGVAAAAAGSAIARRAVARGVSGSGS